MELNTRYLERFTQRERMKPLEKEIRDAHNNLEKGTGRGSDFLGWVHLPSSTRKAQIVEIEETASAIKKNSQAFIVIGIGGSYMGSRAAIEFLSPRCRQNRPCIYFAGNNMDPAYLNNILEEIKDREISINLISKSGTTTEPAIAFRIIKRVMERRYSPSQLKKRIICTTTKTKSALWNLAQKQGYKSFYIPKDVGGRFSVLTAVGLLPMAVAGIDINRVIEGAQDMEAKSAASGIDKNLPYRYAALRNILYRSGKKIEIMSSFFAELFYMLEWWKQLFAESEGKEAKGIFPATAIFSTDLHSIGQLIQEGERTIFETFLSIKKKAADMKIPKAADDADGLNYLAAKGLSYVNDTAYEGTALAHMEGGVPNMAITIAERSAFCLGELFYFFQRAVGASGYLLKINPFDQPGVEAYKKNMFRLLGKPR